MCDCKNIEYNNYDPTLPTFTCTDCGKEEKDISKTFSENIEKLGYKTTKQYSKVIGRIKYNDR